MLEMIEGMPMQRVTDDGKTKTEMVEGEPMQQLANNGKLKNMLGSIAVWECMVGISMIMAAGTAFIHGLSVLPPGINDVLAREGIFVMTVICFVSATRTVYLLGMEQGALRSHIRAHFEQEAERWGAVVANLVAPQPPIVAAPVPEKSKAKRGPERGSIQGMEDPSEARSLRLTAYALWCEGKTLQEIARHLEKTFFSGRKKSLSSGTVSRRIQEGKKIAAEDKLRARGQAPPSPDDQDRPDE